MVASPARPAAICGTTIWKVFRLFAYASMAEAE